MKILSLVFLGIASCFAFTLQTSNTTYTQHKVSAISMRLQFQQQSISDSLCRVAGKYVHSLLKNDMIPAWYGTTWDFFGTSEVPGKGKIACGYFVSTTLRDAGFNLNRYKMAQQHSFDEVTNLTQNVFSTYDLDSLHTYLKKEGEGLYILGLSNHVGYISVEKNTIRFIHSNYLDPACVMSENLLESPAVLASAQFKVGAITTNTKLMKKWINGELIIFR